jgi:hypothetical protein
MIFETIVRTIQFKKTKANIVRLVGRLFVEWQKHWRLLLSKFVKMKITLDNFQEESELLFYAMWLAFVNLNTNKSR